MTTMNAELDRNGVVVRRPHYRLRGRELFFLISTRPYATLSEYEMGLWEAIDDKRTLAQLRSQCGERCESSIRRLLELNVCELVSSKFPAQRRRVVVIEPHSDDAALSIGGTMWLRRNECEFTVVTIASRSNFTSYFYSDRDYFGLGEVSELRNKEATTFARMLGGNHVALDEPEATVRYRGGDWRLDWYRRHRYSVSAFVSHRSSDEELEAWCVTLRAALSRLRMDELWMPIGVGPHTDHELARNACLRVLTERSTIGSDCVVRLYQEVPYAARNPGFTRSLVDALRRSGMILAPEVVPIDAVYPDKLRLISLFASQFKLKALERDIEGSARLAAEGGGLAELMWRVDRVPESLDAVALYVDEAMVREWKERLSEWASRHRNCRRMRIVLFAPAGRWRQDIPLLLEMFPSAHFEVHVSSDAAAEVEDVPLLRIHVRRHGRGIKAWAGLLLRLSLSRPTPTIFLPGERRLDVVRRVAGAVPMWDAIVMPTMDHLLLSLGRDASASERGEGRSATCIPRTSERLAKSPRPG